MKFKKSNVMMVLLIAVLVIGGLIGASVIKQRQNQGDDVVVQGGQLGTGNMGDDNSEVYISPEPTKEPAVTPEPTEEPSTTPEPTKEPTKEPTATPTPTKKPTVTPTPTKKPTVTPTPTKKPTVTPTPTKKPTATPTPTKKPTVTPTPTKKPTATPTPTKKPTVTPSPTPTKKPTATPIPTKAPTATPTPALPTCTITIRCDTILSNMENLTEGKSGLVPSDGYILKKTTVEFAEGETVFDVLSRVCKNNRIQLEYAYTPAYKSYYIEGINNLYEFDCGPDSGWMYKVNGWFPNYGCSSYPVKEGDEIVWCYTCNGLGADVGASQN